MENVTNFVAEYWLSFLCTGLGGLVTAIIHKLYKRYKAGKDSEQNKPFEDFKSEIGSIVKNNLEIMTNRQNSFEERIENGVFAKVEEKEEEFNKEEKTLLEKMTTLSGQIENSIKAADIRKQGLLYLYKKNFLEDCERLLESEHIITHDEYEDICQAHKHYKDLGGNHQGDILFKAIEEKYLKAQKNKRGTN